MWWITLAAAWAARSPCDALKPRHGVDPATAKLAESALRSAMAVVPVPGASAVNSLLSAAPDLAKLGQDPGARDWTLYRVCILKEAGMLSVEQAQAITASLVSPQQAPPAPAMPPAPAPMPPPVPSPAPPLRGSAPLLPMPNLPPAPEGMTTRQAAGRANLVRQAQTACTIGGWTSPACNMYRTILDGFDHSIQLPPDLAVERMSLTTAIAGSCVEAGPSCDRAKAALDAFDADHPPGAPAPPSPSEIATQRANLAAQLAIYCSTPGGEKACAQWREMLATFDAEHPPTTP